MDSEMVSGVRRCTMCGVAVVPIRITQLPSREQEEEEAIPAFLARQHKKPTSKRALAKLRRIVPDHRTKTLEPQVNIKVAGLDLMGIPAQFGPIAALSERPVKFFNTTLKDFTFPANAARGGAIAVVLRGDITFAAKAKLCSEAGFVGLVIVQTFPVWPFTLADSTKEASGISIPVVAISQESGRVLMEYLIPKSTITVAETRVRMSFELQTENEDFTCAICHDNLVDDGDEEARRTICQLPCLHYFHEECILPWLGEKNSCPNCRFELDAEDGNTSAAASIELGWFG